MAIPIRASLLFPSPGRTSRFAGRVLCGVLLLFVGAMGLRAQGGDGPDRVPGGQMVRGTVTAVTANVLTLKTETGDAVKVSANENTRVLRSRQSSKFDTIRVGEGVGAAGVLDPATGTLHAAFMGVIDVEEVRRAQAELGKSFILGRIAGMDELKLTIQRPDGVRQVIAVDESTSFRRGGRRDGGAAQPAGGGKGTTAAEAPTGESITLADLKVGDSVAGRGALKNGVFVPTELHVFVPGQHLHRGSGDRSAAKGEPGPQP